MILASRRVRMLLGGLSFTTVVWATDWITGRGAPQPALAGEGVATPAASQPAPLDVDALIAAITLNEPSDAIELDFRDPFTPSGKLLELEQKPAPAAARDPAAQAAADAPTFDHAHVLHAAIIGDVPLALVDGVLLSIGAELDGLRLAEIYRDHVIFRDDRGAAYTLRLEPR